MAGWLRNLTEFHYPSEIRDRLDRLKSGVEATNKTEAAKENAAWKQFYADFGKYYETTYNEWGITYSQGTVDSIEAREKQIAAWQKKFAAEVKQGGYDGPIQETAKPDPLDEFFGSTTAKVAAAVVVGVILLRAIK